MGNPFEQPTLPNNTSVLEAENTRLKTELENAQRREQGLMDQLLTAPLPSVPVPATPPAVPPSAPPVPQSVSSDLETIIRGARMLVVAEHPDFVRFAQDIDRIMSQMPVDARKQVRIWEEVYWNVRGRHADELVTEARNAPPSPASRPTPAPTPITEDHVTDSVETDMMNKMGYTEKQWLERRKQIKEGQWEVPLT